MLLLFPDARVTENKKAPPINQRSRNYVEAVKLNHSTIASDLSVPILLRDGCSTNFSNALERGC